ncbi:Protein of unknown function DUF229 [Trinorchestia longiramus]|nr:Protein of unknown function DUF229 [Trinorchestia longiramus]
MGLPVKQAISVNFALAVNLALAVNFALHVNFFSSVNSEGQASPAGGLTFLLPVPGLPESPAGVAPPSRYTCQLRVSRYTCQLCVSRYTCQLRVSSYTSSTTLVSTEGCSITGLLPSSSSSVSRPMQLECYRGTPLTSCDGQVVRLSTLDSPNSSTSLSWLGVLCCGKNIFPSEGTGSYYRFSACRQLSRGVYTTAQTTAESVLVLCWPRLDASQHQPSYVNVHNVFPRKKIQEKIAAFKQDGDWSQNPEKLRVLIFRLGFVSRTSLERQMPRTWRWLHDRPAFLDFQGFNKISEDTDQNLLALLSGIHPYHMNLSLCYHDNKVVWKDCPLIWKQFSDRGYVTSLSQDASELHSFLERHGLLESHPTDFNNHAGFLVSDDFISWSPKESISRRPASRSCQGPKPSLEVIHDHVLQGLEATKEVPYFGLAWSSSSTEDNLDVMSTLDHVQVKFLQNLENSGHLNNTAVFFMSDQGVRHDRFRSTYFGSIQERLPFMFLSLPTWVTDKYPKLVKNLRINTQRLVTSLDFYHTLRSILNQNFKNVNEKSNTYYERQTEKDFTRGSQAVFMGQSLFREVSSRRNCLNLGIPERYCACRSLVRLPIQSAIVEEAAQHIVRWLNSKLKHFPLCRQRTLREVLVARIRMTEGGSTTTTDASVERSGLVRKQLESQRPAARMNPTAQMVLFVIISSFPEDARFEATLMSDGEGQFHVMADVSRVSRYEPREGKPSVFGWMWNSLEEKFETKLESLKNYSKSSNENYKGEVMNRGKSLQEVSGVSQEKNRSLGISKRSLNATGKLSTFENGGKPRNVSTLTNDISAIHVKRSQENSTRSPDEKKTGFISKSAKENLKLLNNTSTSSGLQTNHDKKSQEKKISNSEVGGTVKAKAKAEDLQETRKVSEESQGNKVSMIPGPGKQYAESSRLVAPHTPSLGGQARGSSVTSTAIKANNSIIASNATKVSHSSTKSKPPEKVPSKSRTKNNRKKGTPKATKTSTMRDRASDLPLVQYACFSKKLTLPPASPPPSPPASPPPTAAPLYRGIWGALC